MSKLYNPTLGVKYRIIENVYTQALKLKQNILKNTYNEHRANINATILPTLKDPLLIVKGFYENKSALTFYKPFKNETDDLLNIMMYKAILEDNGTYKFRTIYEAHSIYKVLDIIKTLDLNTIYFKFDR